MPVCPAVRQAGASNCSNLCLSLCLSRLSMASKWARVSRASERTRQSTTAKGMRIHAAKNPSPSRSSSIITPPSPPSRQSGDGIVTRQGDTCKDFAKKHNHDDDCSRPKTSPRGGRVPQPERSATRQNSMEAAATITAIVTAALAPRQANCWIDLTWATIQSGAKASPPTGARVGRAISRCSGPPFPETRRGSG
jgi:hypothetical protein